jgi:hypothetical protein
MISLRCPERQLTQVAAPDLPLPNFATIFVHLLASCDAAENKCSKLPAEVPPINLHSS